MKNVIAMVMLTLFAVAPAIAKPQPTPVLTMHILKVDMQQHSNGDGWHLMHGVVGDKLYGLEATYGFRFGRDAWLGIGVYTVKRTNDGFQVDFKDDKGKAQHIQLRIQSEEQAY
jgi:hypothetical protein